MQIFTAYDKCMRVYIITWIDAMVFLSTRDRSRSPSAPPTPLLLLLLSVLVLVEVLLLVLVLLLFSQCVQANSSAAEASPDPVK